MKPLSQVVNVSKEGNAVSEDVISDIRSNLFAYGVCICRTMYIIGQKLVSLLLAQKQS
jgi:hypothetical protein